MTIKLGIIGTAFRGKDTDYDAILTKDLFLNKIYPKALEIIKELKVDTVISGGAAGIDHLAILIYEHEFDTIKKLEIYYPTKFTDTITLIAKTLIKYHLNFSTICFDNPYCSLGQLGFYKTSAELLSFKEPITFSEEPISTKYEGFFNRNKKIANNSDYLLVFSYFDNGNCLTNGTKNTIDKFLKVNSKNNLIKIDIRDL